MNILLLQIFHSPTNLQFCGNPGQILYSLHDDNGDMTSTTTGLDLESMLDGPTENTSDDDDLSTTIDTTDAHAIRRQLESLESMYTEVS